MQRNKQDLGLLTSGEIARLFGCAAKTVADWIDSGRLPGFRLPPGSGRGCGDRRVFRRDVVAFARAQGLPMSLLLNATPSILLIGCEPSLVAAMRELLPDTIRVVSAHTTFAAGEAYSQCRPEIVYIDCQIGRSEAAAIAHHITSQPGCTASLVAIAPEDIDDTSAGCLSTRELGAAGFHAVYRRPFNPAVLAAGQELLPIVRKEVAPCPTSLSSGSSAAGSDGESAGSP